MGGFYLNQPDEYFTDIEDAVTRKRGKRYTANPTDWAVMEQWKTQGIPKHIIVRAIDKLPKFYSLNHCSQNVEKEHADWLPSQVGRSVDVNPECSTCNGAKEVGRKPDGALYDWQLEFIACPDCATMKVC